MSKARQQLGRLWLMWVLRLLSGQKSRWAAAHQAGQTWVAILGHPACERPVHGGHRAAQVERHVAGLVAFSERTAGQRSFHVLPSDAPVQFRLAGVFSSSAVCGSLSLRPAMLAGVAVHSISVTTTAQHVLWRGFWVGAGSRWSLRLLVFVARLGERQDPGHVAPNRLDERRVEVLADGLPLFHGAHLAVDTTLVSVLGRNGEPPPRCADVDGVILEEAKRRKERRYLELSGRHGRTRFGGAGGGSVRQVAKAKAFHEPGVLRESARQAWLRRWRCLLACSAAQAFALSFLERPRWAQTVRRQPRLT